MAQIKSDEEYRAIMVQLDNFLSSKVSDEGRETYVVLLDLLSEMVEEYEKEHFPIDPPSLASTLLSRMRDMNCSQKDVAQIIGISAPRLCDIINGKKEPTYQQARAIVAKLGIDPAIVLSM